ncbi:phage tail protein [Pseudomonas sp. R32]|uniref:phage tail protein n=1 Tax=Pseudomonas sp. R32 TaxID=1573704 RepID=UPI000FB505AD|nr:phage tail protein [Pseudomonas sp. R32]QHF28584.1 phage tail protein [Pseudomonas sp. R32]
MAIETFTWPVQTGEQGDVTFAVRTKRFGDGYEQSVGESLNNRSQSWPVSYTGQKTRVKQIMDFLDRHKGSKAFLWTPPMGELGLYKCASYKPSNRGGIVYTISATFTQTFHP